MLEKMERELDRLHGGKWYDPVESELVIALYDKDRKWYHAEVLALLDFGTVWVKFKSLLS
jgi:hypothetical protein